MRNHTNSSFSFVSQYATTIIFIIYFVLPYLFFALGINFLRIALAPGDGAVQGVPTKIFSATLNLWNPYIQGGTFLFKDIGWQSLYLPGILIMKIFPNPFGYNLLLLAHYSMAGFFTFLYLRKLNLKLIASFIGGITFMFCGFLAAHKGHHTMMMSASYLPVILYFFESFMNTRKISRLFFSAVIFGLSILADYTAVPMYIGMILFPYIIFRVFTAEGYIGRPFFKKILTIMLVSIAIFGAGLMVAAVEVLPIAESLRYINREQISYTFFSSYSFDFKLLPLLIFPYLFGTPSPAFYQPAYFGPWNLTEMAGYMGILPVLFAILSVVLFRNNNKQIYFWKAVALVIFLLVLGDSTPLYKLMYRVPVYSMFRASARNWLEVNFAVAILSSFFIHYLITDRTLTKRRYFLAVTTAVIPLFAAIAFILASIRNWGFSPQIKQLLDVAIQINAPAIYIPLVIVLLSTILLFLLYQYREGRAVWIIVAVFLFFDLFSFGHFHDTAGFLEYRILHGQPNEIANFLNASNQDKNQYRILTISTTGDVEKQLMPNINMLYGFNVVNGYSPIWLKDYTELTTFATNGAAQKKYQLLLHQKILSLLSTKYIITSDDTDRGFLQTVSARTDPSLNKLIVDGFKNNRWDLVSATETNEQNVTLGSEPPGQLSLVQTSFAIQPNTVYTITFKARLKEGRQVSEPLIVDFFGESYDFLQQEASFDKASLTNKFQEINVDFYSGETVPSLAYLRFFTYFDQPYEIRDVKMIENASIASNQPSSGDNQGLYNATPRYNIVYESPDGITVYENPNFLPRARFVDKIRVVNNSAAATKILWNQDRFDPATTALVENYSGPKRLEAGEVLDVDYSNPSAVKLSVKTGENGFLLLADSWYPGWKAYVDHQPAKIYKTNAVSRGILITGAGEHTVEFRFVPKSFYLGLLITGMTLTVFVLYYFLIESRTKIKKMEGN